jgi:hypothetical protein
LAFCWATAVKDVIKAHTIKSAAKCILVFM